MTTKNPTPAVSADALLRDVAFALRMARKISNEIRSEEKNRGTHIPRSPRMVRLTDAAPSVTLGA
jgi:hypothetical protein